MSNYVNFLTQRPRRTTATVATRIEPEQVRNRSGSFVFQVDDFTRLQRFLILGSEGGSYSSDRTLTVDAAKVAVRCAALDAARTIELIALVSEEGRAPKNDPAIFALALLAAQPPAIAQLALAALPRVCRTTDHLMQFVDTVTKLRGWGRSLRQAVARWYTSKSADQLAYQVTKYQQRQGWSHRDLLRLTHAVPLNAGQKDVFQYIAQKDKWLASKRAGTRLLVMAEEAKSATIPRLCKMIREEGLLREHIPTENLNDIRIWEALAEKMPLMALTRNLNKMTNIGLLKPLSSATFDACSKLANAEEIKKARLHPFNLLVTAITYSTGKGVLGDMTWKPTPEIVNALEQAFYLSFEQIEPTGKRFMFGVDVSGSMTYNFLPGGKDRMGRKLPGPVSACAAAACLTMVGVRTEPRSYAMGFAHTFRDLGITASDTLTSAMRKAQDANFGSTNCSLPMEYAAQQRLEVDAFVVLTDNETNSRRHPTVALEQYCQRMGINAKLIAVGMTGDN